jgi:AcrR family transcriptional regulator
MAEPSRRERRRLEIRQRIVETALSLFETDGYEATTVTKIAERADIAYGTFFNHFPAKLDVLREVAEHALADLFRDVEEISKRAGSFTDHLVTLFELTAKQTEELGPQARELLDAMMALNFSEAAVSNDARIRQAFRRFLDEGRNVGDFRQDVDLDTLTEVVVGTWYSMFLSWVHFDDYPLRSRATSTGRFLAETFAATAAVPSPATYTAAARQED